MGDSHDAAAPAAAPAQPAVSCIACGSSHSLALVDTAEGSIVASWGRGEDGQLGHGDAEERLRPQAVFALLGAGITSVHCGAEYSVAVSASRRETYAWGWADFGRLGHGDCKDVFIPAPIPALSGRAVASVSCGDTHTLVATDAGELFTFGRNQNGQLGHGGLSDSLVPLQVAALRGQRVTCVAAGAEHSTCCTADGEVYSWGWGRYGNLGDGDTQDRHLPTRAGGLEGVAVARVACGWRHTLAVDAEGRLWSWGWSKYGQLGHGDTRDQLLPKRVDALAGCAVAAVAGGWRHTLAADAEGRLFAWGWGLFGQLGLGACADVCVPTLVAALQGERVAQLASGWKHTMVVTEAGRFYSWGRGVSGQLGRGDGADSAVPLPLPDLSAGSVQVEALRREAHPVVLMYQIPPGDRYAVVPDHADADGGEGDGAAVPDADLGGAAKRHKS
jgi:alpha-tubulin suppressor-like RCC1 family protein